MSSGDVFWMIVSVFWIAIVTMFGYEFVIWIWNSINERCNK